LSLLLPHAVRPNAMVATRQAVIAPNALRMFLFSS
jgi:hypothetical protein